MFNNGASWGVFSFSPSNLYNNFPNYIHNIFIPRITTQKHINKPLHSQNHQTCFDRSRPTNCKASEYAPRPPIQHQPLAPAYVPFLPVVLVLAFEERKIKLSIWVDQTSSRVNLKRLSYESLQRNFCSIEMNAI